MSDDVPQGPMMPVDALWMPFTANRAFKRAPRVLVSASGMHYRDDLGNQVLDATAGLWCVNAGHCRPHIVQAIQHAAATLDYAPGFSMSHPAQFELATKLAALAPTGLDRVFFTNSGSEAVDTALKIVMAYHAARGETTRRRFVGRVRGYHGVGFGGISVGGIENNRRTFAQYLLPHTDAHLPTTHGLAENLFSRGQPRFGAHLADALDDMKDKASDLKDKASGLKDKTSDLAHDAKDKASDLAHDAKDAAKSKIDDLPPTA